MEDYDVYYSTGGGSLVAGGSDVWVNYWTTEVAPKLKYPFRASNKEEFNECYNAIKTIKNRNNFLAGLRDYLRKYDNKQEWTEKYLEVFNE